MRFRASEIADAVGGRLEGPDVEVEGARHDSREVTGGELFVAVVGDRDGHDFIAAAVERGAAAYLTARPAAAVEGSRRVAAIVVADPAAALTRLGAEARRRLPDRVIAITGSVGKTSTKDLLAAALSRRYRTSASVRSFNNELGVPLTLVNAPGDTEALVLEMGARGFGHIAELCEVGRPTIAVVTAVEAVHTELLGDLDGVARAKQEIVESLPTGGVAVLNADNARVAAMAAATVADALYFSVEQPHADVVAEEISLDEELRPRFVLRTPWGRSEVELAVRGLHQVANAAAAAAAALAAGVPLEEAAAGLAEGELSPWRMELRRTPSGATVINDAYNAGPASTAAALRSLAHLPAQRRIAVLGLMAELGAQEAEAHGAVARLAAALDIRLIAVAAPYTGADVIHVPDLAAARMAIGDLGPGDAVLVKGSRVAGLEHLADDLTAP